MLVAALFELVLKVQNRRLITPAPTQPGPSSHSSSSSGDTLWSYQMQRWCLSIAAEYFYAGALREKLCCHSFCQAPRNMRCEAVNEMGSEMSSTHVSGKQCMKVDDECRRIVIELLLYNSRPMPQSINWCSSRLRSLK